ncbi:DUF1189 domain-containing protein [Salisediminibacterium selenitireducens]|uniref:DUF1189 domain-containing protein n=1 Tax=Bacillus selenitireducens (strain ATCC 700615 / DSM 15326 / MLS10) TaxID=439292 RepID=D6XW72_BACIE|nr:DUF1189 domain-containing protein [Salisediminibacterium selenitireducens]ADH99826.1 protein of unknown function DUF1189 [[Bacillus] selenitireducens MLS10]
MNLFKQFIYSHYQPQTIASFVRQRIGRSVLYVFLLMFLTSLPLIFLSVSGFSALYDDLDEQLRDFPEFSVENGQLVSDEGTSMTETDDGTVIIFDPDGEYTPIDLIDYGEGIALLEREAVLLTGDIYETISYQQLGGDFSKADFVNLSESIGGILPLILTLIGLLIYLVGTAMKFIGVTALAAITMFLKRNVVNELKFSQAWVLSAFAVTLPTTLFAFFDLIQFQFPFQFAIYWVIAITMMNLVLKHLATFRDQARRKREEQPETE